MENEIELVFTAHKDGSIVNVFQPKEPIKHDEQVKFIDFVAKLLYKDYIHRTNHKEMSS